MPPIPKGGTVAVTGSAGFVGSWVVKLLLDRGYRVKACVRDADHAKAAFLKQMPGYALGRLTLHSCDIDAEGAFDAVFPGCHGVVHVAADLTGDVAARVDKYQKNVQYIIDSINRSDTVGRLVYTSSIAAVIHEEDMKEYIKTPVMYEGRYPNEANPRRNKLDRTGYSVGKVLAERQVSAAAEASGGRWDALIANPGDNVGPVLAPHQNWVGSWQWIIGRIAAGKSFPQSGAYRPWTPVDVRDDAMGHVVLLESDEVRSGERYIMWSAEAINVEDIARQVAPLFPEAGLDPSLEPLDNFPPKLKEKEAYLRGVWATLDYRNDRARRIGVTFRPFRDSLRDTVEALVTVGGLEPRRRAKL